MTENNVVVETKAEKVIATFNAFPTAEDGFCTVPQLAWVHSIICHAKNIERLCPKSIDSSLALTLDDGSIVEVCNPDQKAFPCFLRKYIA